MNRSALIIGAGPAGSIAAILLSRAGWIVHLIEQHHFPHDKVCGECLSTLGFAVLDRLGLRENFLRDLSPICIVKSRIHSSNGSELRLPLPQPMWGISRTRLDPWLCSIAQQSGVILHQPSRCEKIIDTLPPSPRYSGERSGERGQLRPSGESRQIPDERSNPSPLPSPQSTGERESNHSIKRPPAIPSAQIRHLPTNTLHHLPADFILLADGRGALLPTRPAPTNDLGIKAHFESIIADRDAIDRDAIDLFSVHGHYGGVAPIENNSWNVAFSVPQQKVREHAGNLDALFASLLNENRSLAERFAAAKRTTPWLASPLPRSPVSNHWPANVIPLGNAAAAIEPIGGEGMGLAMRSAELAAKMLVENRFDASELRLQFRQLWRYRSFACRAVAKAVSHRRLANLTLPILKPLPQSWLMNVMGK